MVAYVITSVDLTIVNVALPTIGRKLHFPEADLQWLVRAWPFFVAGIGTAFAFIPISIGALTGVTERDAGWPQA